MDKSYQSILQAANNYENAGEYEDAAQNYSLAGKHREAAAAYKKQCQKEENEDFARYYEACYYSELSESLMAERKMEEAYENISLASNIFGQVERVAKNDYLKHSSLYRRWESEGRLHVMKALKECDLLHGIRIYRANIDSIVREFDRAIRAFERAEKKCKGLGSDPLLQLNIHITWCETYKRLLILKNIEKWEIRKMPKPKPITLKELTIQLITFLKLTFTFKPDTVEKRAKTSLLDASVAYLSNMQTELVKSNRVKVKRQVDMALYTLRALKEFKFSNDEIKASDHVKKAIEIARELRIWKTTDVGDELNDQINRLFEIIFHFNFQFSAPKCPVVNINAYKDYVQFTYDGLDKMDSQNYLRFKIYYDPPHGEAAFEDTITTVLVVRCDEEKDERRLHIEARKEEIESFPVEFPCNLVKAKLSYVASSDCARQLYTKNIFCDELGEKMR